MANDTLLMGRTIFAWTDGLDLWHRAYLSGSEHD